MTYNVLGGTLNLAQCNLIQVDTNSVLLQCCVCHGIRFTEKLSEIWLTLNGHHIPCVLLRIHIVLQSWFLVQLAELIV